MTRCTDCDYCGEIAICYDHFGGDCCRSCMIKIDLETEQAGHDMLARAEWEQQNGQLLR